MNEQTDSEKAFQEFQKELVIELLLGRSKKKIIRKLVKNEWSEDEANEFVNFLAQYAEQLRKSPREREMLIKHYLWVLRNGALWTVGGIAVTIATFALTTISPVGGAVIVAWGAVVYGCYNLYIGLVGWLKHRN